MHALTWLATTPTPSPTSTVDPANVTPGVAGFVGTAVIVLAVVFLLIDMLRRIRRAGYRAEISEQLDAEQLDAEQRATDQRATDQRAAEQQGTEQPVAEQGEAAAEPTGPGGDVSPEGPAKD
jgi:hypothetical protein